MKVTESRAFSIHESMASPVVGSDMVYAQNGRSAAAAMPCDLANEDTLVTMLSHAGIYVPSIDCQSLKDHNYAPPNPPVSTASVS